MRVGEIEYANSYISSTDQKLTYTTQTKKEWKMMKKIQTERESVRNESIVTQQTAHFLRHM